MPTPVFAAGFATLGWGDSKGVVYMLDGPL